MVLLWSNNQDLVYYKFYKNSIVSYTIIAFEETLNQRELLELLLVSLVKATAAF